MATVRFTDADRDSRGFIRLAPPETAEAVSESPSPPSTQRAAPVRPPLSSRVRYQLTISGAAVAGLLLVLLTMRFSAPRAMTTPMDAAPTAVPAVAPTPISQPPSPIPAMLPAYAAPDGAQLGQIEATRDITPTAHYGSDWIQADVEGSGLVWLRASDWPALAITGPDLAPRPTATALPYVSPTSVPQPPCLTAGAGTQTVTVCDWLDPEQLRVAAAAKWAATFGGTIGTVGTPSPQVVR